MTVVAISRGGEVVARRCGFAQRMRSAVQGPPGVEDPRATSWVEAGSSRLATPGHRYVAFAIYQDIIVPGSCRSSRGPSAILRDKAAEAAELGPEVGDGGDGDEGADPAGDDRRGGAEEGGDHAGLKGA